MEKRQDLLRDGGVKLRLPIGFRFCPTDEELLVHYLKRRAFSLPLPASVIPDFNVFHTDPWDLPGDLVEKRYFFSKRKCSRIMPTGSGFWKFIGKGKQIVASGSNQVVGTRRKLGFYMGKHPHGSTTGWVMHQYHLLESSSTQNPVGEVADWCVCLIFQRKRRPRSHGIVTPKYMKDYNLGIDCSSVIDFKMEAGFDLGPPQPCSPCTSDLTTDDLDQVKRSACA
ncbi:hypothetical protein Dimus_018611 [Dionaea muscipula]